MTITKDPNTKLGGVYTNERGFQAALKAMDEGGHTSRPIAWRIGVTSPMSFAPWRRGWREKKNGAQ